MICYLGKYKLSVEEHTVKDNYFAYFFSKNYKAGANFKKIVEFSDFTTGSSLKIDIFEF
jgi:hypothetical protein